MEQIIPFLKLFTSYPKIMALMVVYIFGLRSVYKVTKLSVTKAETGCPPLSPSCWSIVVISTINTIAFTVLAYFNKFA